MQSRASRLWVILLLCLLWACGRDSSSGAGPEPAPEPVERPSVLWGVDANYVRVFEDMGYSWTVDGRRVDVIDELARRGAQVYRLRIWVENKPGNREPGTLGDAIPLARRAQRAGMYVIPTLFMSQGWGADTNQDAPGAWAELPLEARADAAREWTVMAVERLKEAGIRSRTWAIGNETDYGFCGEFRMTADLPVLRQTVWPRAAVLFRATIDGVQQACDGEDPEFILHLSRGYDTDLVLAFFQTMQAENVPVDLAGLSYYPSAWGQERTGRFGETVARLWEQFGLRTFIAETAFPAADTWAGWNKPIAGYSMDPAGQALFLRELREQAFADARIAGAVWWSPEEISPYADWSVNGLFQTADSRLRSAGARPALFELSAK